MEKTSSKNDSDFNYDIYDKDKKEEFSYPIKEDISEEKNNKKIENELTSTKSEISNNVL